MLPRTDLVLAAVASIAMSDTLLESASRLPDPLLRMLDAIHLATALCVRDDVEALITYDDRLARDHGFRVERPSEM